MIDIMTGLKHVKMEDLEESCHFVLASVIFKILCVAF